MKGDGEVVASVAAGYGTHGGAPYQQIGDAVSGDDLGGSREAVDHEQASRWAMIGAVFIALIAIVLVVTYRLLPNGAFARLWRGEMSGPGTKSGEEDDKWDNAYNAAPSAQKQMSIV